MVASVTSVPSGTATPCSASSALPSASISSTSVGPEAQDALVEIEVADDLAADQVAQRLRGAAAERAVARAAIEARHRIFVGEAVAAVQLHRLAVTRIDISLQNTLAAAAMNGSGNGLAVRRRGTGCRGPPRCP